MTVVFIECGTSMTSPFNTGIQKVVRSVVREAKTVGPQMGLQCVPVAFENNNFYELGIEPPSKTAITLKLKGYMGAIAIRLISHAAEVDRIFRRLRFGTGYYEKVRKIVAVPVRYLYQSFKTQGRRTWVDVLEGPTPAQVHSRNPSSQPILILLDSTWNVQMWEAVERFRAAGGHVCAVLYDLIPFSHPDTVEERTREAHTRWWSEVPLHVDSVICISKTVRSQFIAWQKQSGLARQIPDELVAHFYLGSELESNDNEKHLLPTALSCDAPFWLVVGSIEPRKNHAIILDAFEILWAKGLRLSLVIVGGHGWKCEAFLDRVHTHPMFNKQLFLLRRVTDAELGALYNKASSLIIASIEEGFGLPIVEAFQRGVPVICSDIPVFREIGEDRVRYFDSLDATSLTEAIQETLEIKAEWPRVSKISWLTWRESAQQLFTEVLILQGCAETLSKKAK